MITPRNRLLLWTGFVFVPLSLIYAMAPDALPAALAAMLAFCVLVVLDAALAAGALQGFEAHLPEVVRMTKDREGAISATLRAPGRKREVTLALALPRAIESLQDRLSLVLGGDSEAYSFDWQCIPRERGRFRIEQVYLRVPSPFGFWSVQGALPVSAEVRAYPNLHGERTRLAALFLNRGSLGMHAQRQLGKGREFEKLREYIPGDSFEDIHWKATARRAKPVTKVYQIERTQEVYVLIDCSRLSARSAPDANGGGHTSQLERFLTAGLTLGVVAERQGDLFGLVTFSDQVHHFIRASAGQAHYNAVRDALYQLQPRRVNPDFEELFAFLRLRVRRRALLLVLTNLDDPVLSESFARDVQLVNRRHLVLVNTITPPGVAPLFSGEAAESVDEVYERLAGHLQWRDLRELQRGLQHRGVSMHLLDNASLTPELVSQYVNVKQRQLL